MPTHKIVALSALLLLVGIAVVALPISAPPGGLASSSRMSLLATPASTTHLVVRVALQPEVTVSGATVVLRAWVTGSNAVMPGVTVSFSSGAGGTFFPQSATTGTAGEVNASFSAPTVTTTTAVPLTASASSTGTGFLPGSASANLTVEPSGAYLVATPSFPQGTAVHSGASDLVVIRVTDNHGSPVSGATVTMGTTAGTVTPAAATTGSTGNATLTLNAPTVSVATQAWLLFIANASGYRNGSAIAPVTVDSGVAASLYVTLTPASSSVAGGGSVALTVVVRAVNGSGTLVSGADVTLILSDGTSSPGAVVTGTTGTANFTYFAPGSLSRITNVTITASATATNYAAGSATATVTVNAAKSPANPLAGLWWLWLALLVALVAIVVGVVASRRRRKKEAPPSDSPPPRA
jgi:hypothetical protein